MPEHVTPSRELRVQLEHDNPDGVKASTRRQHLDGEYRRRDVGIALGHGIRRIWKRKNEYV
jgi:hypothetical protein